MSSDVLDQGWTLTLITEVKEKIKRAPQSARRRDFFHHRFIQEGTFAAFFCFLHIGVTHVLDISAFYLN